MDLLAPIGTTTTAVELFAALVLALTFVGRPSDREFGTGALVATAAAVRSTCELLVARGATSFVVGLAHFVAAACLVGASCGALHFAFVFSGSRSRWIPPLLYAQAASWITAWVVRRFAWGRGASHLSAVASSEVLARHAGRLAPLYYADYVFPIVAATAALILAASAYLSARRGAMGVVVGTTILLAVTLNDFGVASGAFSTGYLTDLGLAAFSMGIALTPASRYVAAAFELERRTQELRSRTRELRQSYEELRAAQEELVKKEQLAVVGELAAVIAHEVRNPLAIIANAVAGLRRIISREDHDVLLSILDEETSRLNRLVTDLLRYARPVNIQRSLISLSDLLERALALAHTGAKSIRMELNVEAHEGRLWGDANLLRQVFDNLIDNAIQAMGSGGTLTVRVRAKSEEGADGIAVDIIDTGEGMDTQVRSRALDPFFTTRPSGTGLGLAIVDRIVDAHGGHLAIESRAGEGTTVTVFLPHGTPSDPPPRSRLSKAVPEPPVSAPAA